MGRITNIETSNTFELIFNESIVPQGIITFYDGKNTTITCNNAFAELSNKNDNDSELSVTKAFSFVDNFENSLITDCYLSDKLLMSKVFYSGIKSYKITFKKLDKETILFTVHDITSSEIIRKELKDNEAIFRSVFDRAPIAIVLVNNVYKPIFCNPQFSKLVGRNTTEIYHKSLKEIIHPDDFDINNSKYLKLFNGEINNFSIVNRFIKADKSLLWAKVTVSAISHSSNDEPMAIVMVQDITAEKEATEALVKSEYKYRALIDNADDGIALFDFDFKPIVYNDVIYEMMGYTEVEYLKFDHNKHELFHPDDIDCARQALAKLRKGEKVRIENRMKKKDDSYGYYSINYIPVTHEGNPAILIFRRDITKRKIAEEQSEEYRNFLETLMDNMPVSLFAKTTPDFRYLYWNNTFEKVTGIPAEDAIGKTDFELMQFKKLAEQYFNEDKKIVKTGRKLESEHEFTNSIGEIKHFKTIKTVHKSTTGTPLILGLSVDITKLKEAEKQIEQSTQMLKEAQKIAKLGYWEYDVKKDLFFDNLENRQILGTESLPYFISYNQFVDLLHERDRDRVKMAFNKCIKNKMPGEGIVKVIDGDEYKHVSIKYKPIENEQGKVEKLRGTCLDITRLRKSEVALRESESRLKQAEHIAKVGYWNYDFVKNKTKFSDEILKILEVQNVKSKISLNDFFNCVHDDDKIAVTSQYQRSKKTNEPINLEFKIVTHNNNVKHIKAIGTFVKNQDGSLARLIGTFQDITDLKKNEVALEKSSLQLKEIQNAARIGFIEQFINSNHVKFSSTLLKVLELNANETIRDIEEYNKLIHPNDKPTILKTIQKSLAKKQSYNIQYRLQLTSGKTVFVNEICSINTVNPKAVVTRIIQDITTLKEQKRVLDTVTDVQEAAMLGVCDYNILNDRCSFNKGLASILKIKSGIKHLRMNEYLDFLHPDDRHSVETLLLKSIKLGECFSLNYRLVVNDKILFIEQISNFYKNASDEDVMYSTLRDITNYRITQNELNEKAELFRSITDNSLFGIVIYQEGKRVFINKKWFELIGKNPDNTDEETGLDKIYKPETYEIINDIFRKWEEYNLTEYSNKINVKPLNANEFVAEMHIKAIHYKEKPAQLIIAIPHEETKEH